MSYMLGMVGDAHYFSEHCVLYIEALYGYNIIVTLQCDNIVVSFDGRECAFEYIDYSKVFGEIDRLLEFIT